MCRKRMFYDTNLQFVFLKIIKRSEIHFLLSLYIKFLSLEYLAALINIFFILFYRLQNPLTSNHLEYKYLQSPLYFQDTLIFFHHQFRISCRPQHQKRLPRKFSEVSIYMLNRKLFNDCSNLT